MTEPGSSGLLSDERTREEMTCRQMLLPAQFQGQLISGLLLSGIKLVDSISVITENNLSIPELNSETIDQLILIKQSYVRRNFHRISLRIRDRAQSASADLHLQSRRTAKLHPDCIYNILPQFQSYSASGGSGSINVVTEDRCTWQAESNANWITITSNRCAI